MPRFRLLTERGDDLGPFHSSAPNWAPGDRIPCGPGNDLVVVDFTPADDEDDIDGFDIHGYLVVKPAV